MDYPYPEKETNALPGLIFLSGNSENGGSLSRVDDLIGKKINSISSCEDGILASMQDGLYNVTSESTSCVIKDTEYKNVAAGKGFMVAQTPDGTLYSWGKGFNGQLGLGVTRFTNETPAIMKNSKFSAVSCGEAFSIAVDESGKAYAWGENFDRQLALYTKKQESMHLKNAFVEDMSFVPRLIPFTFKNFVQKVACGDRFVVALTKVGGKVYSWGAGECGQLGTGRCTKRDLPEEVKIPLLPYQTETEIADVACGSGHIMLVSTDGLLYACGLNKSGQLGLGDTSTRFSVQCLYSGDDDKSTGLTVIKARDLVSNEPSTDKQVRFSKVFANGHSSAAVDSNGVLYTWGSEAHHRLIHPFDVSSTRSHSAYPAEVSTKLLDGSKVENFSFAKECSAIYVLSTICSLSPTIGPRRSFSTLNIHGYGLWESKEIIVKFSPKTASIYNLPRSCSGNLTGKRVITCKPPKFAESGYYIVTVSLDGYSFLKQSLEVYIYKDLVVTQQFPTFLDARNICNSSVKVHVSGNIIPNEGVEVEHRVKLQFYSAVDNHLKHKDKNEEVSRKADKMQYHPSKVMLEVEVNAIVESVTEETSTQVAPGQAILGATQKAVTIETVLTCDFSSVDGSIFDTLLGKGLFEMKSVVSVNMQDYSAVNLDSRTSSIVHSFCPKKLTPCCLSFTELESTFIATGREGGEKKSEKVQSKEELDVEKVVAVVGSSFIPNFRLPKGNFVEAVLTGLGVYGAQNASEEIVATDPKPFTLNLPSHCEHPDSLHFVLSADSLEQLYNMMLATDRSLQFDVSFNLTTTSVTTGTDSANTADAADADIPVVNSIIALSTESDLLRYTVYGDYKVAITPSACRKVAPPRVRAVDDVEVVDEIAPTPTVLCSIMYAQSDDMSVQKGEVALSKEQGFLFVPGNPVICLIAMEPATGWGDGPSEEDSREQVRSILRQPLLISTGVRVKGLPIPPSRPVTSNEGEFGGEYADSRPGTSGTEYSEFGEPQVGDDGYEEYMEMKSAGREDGPSSSTPFQTGYKVEFDLCPDLITYFKEGTLSANEVQALAQVEMVLVGVMLDGKSLPDQKYWAELSMYGNIGNNLTIAPVKGGYVSGATIEAVVDGFIPASDACIVRIRGLKPEAFIDMTGTVLKPGKGGSISFTLTDTTNPGAPYTGIEPVVNGKEKMCYVDISIDGGNTFNVSEVPKLQIK